MMKHYSVLAKETINKLRIKSDGVYVDCTLGLGGHTKLLAAKASNGKVISFDQDSIAMKKAKENLKEFSNITFINDNFSNLSKRIKELGIEKIDGIIYDLGTSYYQLTDEKRGFSYHGESKLDMRMNIDQEFTAINVINDYSEEELARVMFEYGDEPKSRRIAKAIVDYRERREILLNKELNDIIKSVKGFVKGKHPSKNIFQAIRIEVNNEIEVIKESLEQAINLLKKNGVIAVITFHSLEDKTVKDIFWNKKEDVEITTMGNNHKYKTSKVIYPSKEEIAINKASRSGKLRTLVKLID